MLLKVTSPGRRNLEEVKITFKGNERRKTKAEGVQNAMEEMVSQAQMKEANKEETKQVVGWSTERMEEKTSK